MLRKLAITLWKKCSALEAFGSEESVLSDHLYIAKHSGVLNLTCRDLALVALLDAHLLSCSSTLVSEITKQSAGAIDGLLPKTRIRHSADMGRPFLAHCLHIIELSQVCREDLSKSLHSRTSVVVEKPVCMCNLQTISRGISNIPRLSQ
jgi:hypothetical protein